VLDLALLKVLGGYSTPAIFNGMKRLGTSVEKLANVDHRTIHCMAPALGPRIGFAATRKIATRRNGPPVEKELDRHFLREVNHHICSLPSPRFLVVENVGDFMGRMCIWGEVAANINLAMECVAGLTNGPVRDLPEMAAAGFLTFARGAAMGGGHVDTLEVGTPVNVGGLIIAPGDLLHGDLHGVIKIPIELAPQLPQAIQDVENAERRIIEYCRSDGFSPEGLADLLSRAPPNRP
jgi:regulator of RNase E activity RraA